MKNMLAVAVLVVMLAGGALVLAVPAWAFSAYPVCNTAPSGSAVCSDQGNGSTNPLTGPNGVIVKATAFTAAVAGLIAVIIIILAGLSFVTSGGDAAKAKTAKATILYTVAGLAIILLAGSILSLVVSKL